MRAPALPVDETEESPAPIVTLTAEEGGHGTDAATEEEPANEEIAADDTDDDGGADTLSILALVVGALGLVVGAVALVSSRRSD